MTSTTDESHDGGSVKEKPQNTFHDLAVGCLKKELLRVNPTGWQVRFQRSIVLVNSVPEPDAALVRNMPNTDNPHIDSHLGIVIEVAERSLWLDRGPKAMIYPRSGILVYWIINVVDRQIEVYSDPNATANPPAYATRNDFKPGDVVPIVLDGNTVGTIPVADLIA